jgi:hypothetical protein
MPTRVLLLSGETGKPSVKLLETFGIRGSYCALSNCWGPVEKRPLRTTRDNFRQHLEYTI